MSPFNALKHLVYFEMLAETDEGSDAWNTVTAGLVVLRLLDTWYDFGPQVLRENARGVKNIRTAIDAVEENQAVREILSSIVQRIERARHPDLSEILPQLMSYGEVLLKDGHWTLAADAFETVLGFAGEEDTELAMRAHAQMGQCERMLGEWEDAAMSFAAAGQIAAARGDIDAMLRARIADARLAIDRGNLPQAEALLEDCITQSGTSDSLSEVRELALKELAAVVQLRGG